MKRFLSRESLTALVVAVSALVVSALAAPAQADDAAKVVGDWQLKVSTDDGQTLTSTLKLNQKDGKLQGVFVGMDGTEAKVDEITAKDDALNFKVILDFQGTE